MTMHGYSADYCRRMITHYERQTRDQAKPHRWRDTARASATEWRYKLKQLEADQVAKTKPGAYQHTPMIFNCTPSYQDIFDTTCEHLARQKKQAAVWDTRFPDSKVIACRYRTDDGCACVEGHFIPDDVYRPAAEGNIVYRIAEDISPTCLSGSESTTYLDCWISFRTSTIIAAVCPT
jgi:hypothetical protein